MARRISMKEQTLPFRVCRSRHEGHIALQKCNVSQGLRAVLGEDINMVPPRCWMLKAQAINLVYPLCSPKLPETLDFVTHRGVTEKVTALTVMQSRILKQS